MIAAEKTLPSGQVLTRHEIVGRRIDMANLRAMVTVASWSSGDLSQSAAVTQEFTVTFDSWTPERLDELQDLLLALPEWQDWDLLPPARTLEQARAEAWERIKDARSHAEFGGFTYDGNAYDSDSISVQRIMGSVSMAMLAQQAGAPYANDFTLADNSVVTLDAPTMIAVGLALGAHVQAVHSHGRAKRASIEAASTLAALDAITWASVEAN